MLNPIMAAWFAAWQQALAPWMAPPVGMDCLLERAVRLGQPVEIRIGWADEAEEEASA